MGCRRARSRSYAALAAASLIAGCAGNGNGLDVNGRPLASGSAGPDVPLTDDFDSIQTHIFTPICSVCHVGGSAPQGLRLDADNSYALLVGVASTEVPSIDRVKPGDPDDSYIIQKLEGHAAVGARMPFGGPYLSTDTIAVIRQWVTNGAQASASAAASGAVSPLALTAMTPGPGEIQTQPLPQLMLGVNHELDVTRLDTSAIRLERIDATALSTPIAIRMTYRSLSPHSVLIWPALPLPVGRYRLAVEYGALSDLAGNRLGGIDTTFDVETAP